MSEDAIKREIKLSDLFLKESDVSDSDHSDLWFNADEILPACVIESKQMIMTLGVNGFWKLDENDKFYNDLSSIKVSKLVLTFGRDESTTFKAHYEIGFFDGDRFRQLSGYAIYPPPSHWMAFPKPPQIKNHGEIRL